LTYYQQQLVKIKEACFFKDYIYDQLIQAKQFIDLNYAQSLKLTDIAEKAFLSKYHFARLFRNAYGRTPHQYLTAIRIEKAKKLLMTDSTVMDVCFAVGFNSVSSFTGLFKRITGTTPAAYQAKKAILKK
jgi:AraC-like DNA-binding protein